jgi:hypothetical protein
MKRTAWSRCSLALAAAGAAVLALFVGAAGAAQHSAARGDSIAQRLGIGAVTSGSFAARPFAGGLSSNIVPGAPFSAALATNISGSGSPLTQSLLLGNWDGQDAFVAEHSGVTLDCGASPPVTCPPGSTLTRSAVSEHTVANGFNENIFYVGDSVGNVQVLFNNSTSGSIAPDGGFTINLPTTLNAFGTLNSGSRIVITGLAVNPVADLTSFSNVNGAYTTNFHNVTGEILYVSFLDTGGDIRLISNGQIVHSGVLAFPVSDAVSPAPSPPGGISPTGFPVTVGGAFGVVFSAFDNVGGIALDDEGNLYFHQADLTNLTGGNVVEIASVDDPTGAHGGPWQDRSLATNGFVTLTTLNPPGGVYPGSNGPTKQINRATNYSGTSPVFGNIAALAAGPGNRVYAAVSASLSKKRFASVEGPFTNPKNIKPTPNMIISFADYRPAGPGLLPVADGFADPVDNKTLVPGKNNFTPFVLGTGAKMKNAKGVLKIDPFQVDYSIYSGIAVDQANTVYVISGGTPNNVGLDPSPNLGEILAFPDTNPFDRHADAVNFRGDSIPPPAGISNGVFDKDSDRFDHIYLEAPLDGVTLTPEGIAGLNTGLLRYLNRTAPNTITNLPNGNPQIDDGADGPINFNDFDKSIGTFCGPSIAQVAGGDPCNAPFRGSDDGFEYVFDTPQLAPETSFFLNSNGSISFGAGDTAHTSSPTNLATGVPRIAGAWTDLNPSSRSISGDMNTFPVQALGFASPHQFIAKWIDVPEFGQESNNSSNSFSISMFDNGTGLDDVGPNRPDGPRAPRLIGSFGTAILPACSGYFTLNYGRMDVLGSPSNPVTVGYSTGGLGGPSGALNLSTVGAASLLGDGTQNMLYEEFPEGNMDLKSEGANKDLSKVSFQPDSNQEQLVFAGHSCS